MKIERGSTQSYIVGAVIAVVVAASLLAVAGFAMSGPSAQEQREAAWYSRPFVAENQDQQDGYDRGWESAREAYAEGVPARVQARTCTLVMHDSRMDEDYTSGFGSACADALRILWEE